METLGSPASTARSVAREIPARLAISTVLRPWNFRRRLSLSPNWRSNWRGRTEESLYAFIYSAFWTNESMLVKALSTPCASTVPNIKSIRSSCFVAPVEAGRSSPQLATPGHQVPLGTSHESRKVTSSSAHQKRRPRGHAFAEVAPGACFEPMIAVVFKLIAGLYRVENQCRLTTSPACSLLPVRW